MLTIESTPLISFFEEIDSAADERARSFALGKAKKYILNDMTDGMIKDIFALDKMNFESLFALQIWTSDFVEPYEIMEKIFGSFSSLIEFIDEFYCQILFTINQTKDEKVKHICVQNLIRLTKCLNANEFEKYQDPCGKLTALEGVLKHMLISFVQQIPYSNVRYSELLGQLFCQITTVFNKTEGKIIEKYHNMTAVFSTSVFDDNPELNKEFERVAGLNCTMKIRVLDIFIKIATLSKDHLVSISEQNFIDKNLKDLINSDDILTKLNVIELLADLSITFHGYEFLHHKGHLRRLFEDLLEFNILKDKDTNPFGSIQAAAIVKIFAYITKVMPESIHRDFPEYLNIIFEYGLYEDVLKWEFQINLALQTFAYLFESNIIKMFVYENYKNMFNAFLCRLAYIVRHVIGTEIKCNSITCISLILALDPALLAIEHSDAKWLASPWMQSMEETTLNFFRILVTDCSEEVLFQTLFEYAREPFRDLRLTAHLFLKALAQSKWGIKFLFSEKKFLKKSDFVSSYLINRRVEVEKEGLESKLELIKLICANFKLNYELFPIIGEGDLEKLEEYIRLGAYYTPSGQSVAFESA